MAAFGVATEDSKGWPKSHLGKIDRHNPKGIVGGAMMPEYGMLLG